MSIIGGWIGVEVRPDGLQAAMAWPDATVMILPLGRVAGATTGGTAAAPGTGPDWVAAGRDGGPDLVAGFRQVAQVAAAVTGGGPAAATVVVPAGWRAQQLPQVRAAAALAGFAVVEVLPAPVAVGWHLLAGGVALAPGALVLVCAVDTGCSATVLRRTGGGFEVMSTVDAATVAADMLALPAALEHPAAAGSPGRWVPEVARRAMAGAQLPPGVFDLVCAVGPGADVAVGRQLAQVCGVEPMLVAEPQVAALLGAVQRGPAVGAELRPARPVGWRDAVAVVLPGLCSVALVAQFLAGGQRYGPVEKLPQPGMLLAPWGVLAFASMFGLAAVVAGLVLAAAARADGEAGAGRGGAGWGWVGHRLTAVALGGAALAGLVVAGVYALVAAGFFDLAPGPLLRWSVLPVVPAAVAVAGLGAVVWRRPDPPLGWSWPRWVRLPPVVIAVAAVGAVLVGFDETGAPWVLQPLAWLLEQWMPSGGMSIIGPVGRIGGVCIGAAVALLLVRRAWLRLLLGVPLAALVGASTAWPTTGAVAVGFALTVAAWWLGRGGWLLLSPALRRPAGVTADPATYPAHQPGPAAGPPPAGPAPAWPSWPAHPPMAGHGDGGANGRWDGDGTGLR
ncbi:hypothetical protein [Dactylosporangium sp. CA-092794]|uniref:hypothetical protein n=1 Tax=Dactylosporangium sp. CA-092794 TaxID=3239929 RepID=UPI003D8DB7D8